MGSRKAAEDAAQAFSLAGIGFGSDPRPIVTPGGVPIENLYGKAIDEVRTTLSGLNPTLNFQINHQWEQWPCVNSDTFVRLLYDNDNKFASVSRS